MPKTTVIIFWLCGLFFLGIAPMSDQTPGQSAGDHTEQLSESTFCYETALGLDDLNVARPNPIPNVLRRLIHSFTTPSQGNLYRLSVDSGVVHSSHTPPALYAGLLFSGLPADKRLADTSHSEDYLKFQRLII